MKADKMQTIQTWYLMFQTSEHLRNFFIRKRKPQAYRKKWKLTVSQMRLIACIVAAPQLKIKIKDIARELCITSGGVSQLVDSLEKIGLLKRFSGVSDRRVVYVSLSEFGKDIYREALNSQNSMFNHLLEGLSQEKVDIFHEVLFHLQDRLKLIEEEERKDNEEVVLIKRIAPEESKI